jgi:adenosine deaminase
MNTAEFIQRLPKAELHLHLEGAIPWDMVRDYADVPLAETPAWWANDFRYTDFSHLLIAMRLGIQYVLNSVESYQDVARAIFNTLADQNVRYVEISFGANVVVGKELAIADVCPALREALPQGMNGVIFGAFNRERPRTLEDELVQLVFDSPVDGIDLHGSETLQSAIPYTEIFDVARQRGLMTKAHAGELRGAASVWEVLKHLKVKRIEHGTRSIEDEKLVQHLVDEQITLDMCPTSNFKLNVVESVAMHPIRRLLHRGVRVTVNSDDPTYFGCSLTEELQLLVDVLGFTLPELAEVEKNAFRVAKITDDERDALFMEIDALVSELD